MSKSNKKLVRVIAQTWMGHLAHFRRHLHPEHLEALYEETRRFAGIQLENDLSASVYWSAAPLATRAAVLLYLIDRGVVNRRVLHDRVVYEACMGAEAWVACQPELASHIVPALELVAALRNYEMRRSTRAQ
jgi:hypothetical protein